MKHFFLWTLVWSAFGWQMGKAQPVPALLDKTISLQLGRVSLATALQAIGQQAGCTFVYSDTHLNAGETQVQVSFNHIPLKEVLQTLLGEAARGIRVDGNQVTITPSLSPGRLVGTVRSATGEPLPNATVRLKGGAVTQSDASGYFSLSSVPAGKQGVTVTSVGYNAASSQVMVRAGEQTSLDLQLSPEGFLNEVVVTAGRKEESIKEVPSSVTILNAKQIQQQAAINPSITSVLGNTVPGLGTFSNKATNSGQTLRGRSVLVLIDGIPQSTPLMNGARDLRTVDPAIIERVEVIKGATSIYGNGSGGGIINFITKKPNGEKPISGETQLSSDGSVLHSSHTVGYRISQTLHGTVDKFSYVLAGAYNQTGVLKDADGNIIAQDDGLSETRLLNLFGKLNYRLTDNQQFTLSYDFFRSEQHSDYVNQAGVYGVSPAVGVKGEDPGEPAGTPHNHNVYLSYQARELPANSTLDVTLYESKFKSMNRYVAQATAWYGPGQTNIQSFKKGLRINLNTPWKLGATDGEVTYGLDLLNDRTNQVLTDGRTYVPNMNMVNLAPFAQLKLDISDLVVKGGVRYENARVKVKDFNTINTGPDGQGSIPVTGGTLTYNATMFNAGVRYTRFDYFNPFVSFSQAFAINELGRVLRRATSNTLGQIQTDPVITNNYEAGFSSELGPVSLTASYYISTSKLGANLVEVDGYFTTQRNPERVHGYEATAEVQILPSLRAGGSYSFVEGKAEQEDGTKTYMNGERITPPKATGFVSYQPFEAFDMQLSMVRTGSRDRFDVRSNTGKYGLSEGPVKPVTIFNFNAGYRISKAFQLGIGVENLLNNAYYPPVSQYRAADLEYVQGNGARINLSAGYRF